VRRIPLGALQEREFRLFFTGQLVSLLGDAVTPFALTWAVLDLTGSARDLGFVLAARIAPLVVFLLVGGVFADRLPRRGVMLTAAPRGWPSRRRPRRCCSRTPHASGS
jgi:MFS family permease